MFSVTCSFKMLTLTSYLTGAPTIIYICTLFLNPVSFSCGEVSMACFHVWF